MNGMRESIKKYDSFKQKMPQFRRLLCHDAPCTTLLCTLHPDFSSFLAKKTEGKSLSPIFSLLQCLLLLFRRLEDQGSSRRHHRIPIQLFTAAPSLPPSLLLPNGMVRGRGDQFHGNGNAIERDT